MDKIKAEVEVFLVDANSDDGGHVYGKISGSFDGGNPTVFFDKEEKENVPLKINQKIPLDPAYVEGVDNSVNFKINVDLKDYNGVESDPTEIAKGDHVFKVQTTGRHHNHTIDGDDGSVKIRITWK